MSFSTWINGFRHYIVSHQRSSKPKTIILALTLLTLTMLRIHSLTAFLFTLVLPGYLLTYLLIPRKTQAKRFILSLPLSLLVLFPLNTLSLLGIPLTKTLLSTVYLTINLSLFIKYRHKILSQLKESFNETTVNELLACLILILFIVVIWTPTLVSAGIPKAHGIIYYSRAEETIASLESNLRFPLWSLFQEMGYPIFTFDPPYYFQAQAIHHLMSWEDFLLINFNTYLLYALIILALSLYLLLRHHLKASPLNAFFACLFLASSNHLVFEAAVNGYTKMITAAPVFLALLSAYLTYVKERGHPQILILLSSATLLYYPAFLVALLILAPAHILISANKKFFRKQTRQIIISCFAVFLITAFFLAPNLLNQKYTKQTSHQTPTLDLLNEKHLTYLFGFSNKVRGAFDLKLTGFIGLCALLASYLSREKTLKTITIIAVFLTLSFLIQTHSTISKMVYFRTANLTLLILFITLFAQSLQILTKKPKTHKTLVAAALILYLIFLLPNAAKQTRNGFTEYLPSGNGEEEIIFLKKQPFGRIISYEIYPHAIDSFFSRHTLKPALGGGFFQAHYSPLPKMILDLAQRRNVGDNLYTIPKDLNYDLTYNLFHRTHMKYLLVGDCKGNTGDAVNIIKTLKPQYIYNRQCIHVYAIDYLQPTSLIEKTHIYRWDMNAKTLMSKPAAYRVSALADGNLGPEISGETDLTILPEPTPLNFHLENTEKIKVTGSFSNGDWVLVKQHYFPRWRATMDGQEIPVYESKLGLMLIQTQKGNKILLENKPFPYEQLLAVISTLTLISVVVGFQINFARKSK